MGLVTSPLLVTVSAAVPLLGSYLYDCRGWQDEDYRRDGLIAPSCTTSRASQLLSHRSESQRATAKDCFSPRTERTIIYTRLKTPKSAISQGRGGTV